MILTTLMQATETVLAVPQPAPVSPPGGEKLWQMVGVALWVFTAGAVLGVIVGGGWMWADHMSDRGATSGKGIKITVGALAGAMVMALSASLVTFVMAAPQA